jgi:hypothetical protein
MNSTSVTTSARRQRWAKKRIVSAPPSMKFHHSQLPAMPSLMTMPLTASGVSDENDVATIEVPSSHQGRLRPLTKYSETLRPARRE